MIEPLPAVILAAGYGSRLSGTDATLPKALVPLRGRPLLSYTLEGLARAGVRRACVVAGYQAAEMRSALNRMDRFGLALDVAVNPRYDLPNGGSLAAARERAGDGPFLLLMADHLLSAAAVERMLAAHDGFAVGIDRGDLAAARLADATRVRLGPDGHVQALGKRLEAWDGIDAGIFRCLPDVFAIVDELGPAPEVSAVMTAAAARYPFGAVDLGGTFWLDVDTPADLAEAERLLDGRATDSVSQPVDPLVTGDSSLALRRGGRSM